MNVLMQEGTSAEVLQLGAEGVEGLANWGFKAYTLPKEKFGLLFIY